jgi:RNase_H superfamily
MNRKFVAFDIETATDVPGTDFNWKPHRPLGISCAATLAAGDEAPRLWHGGASQAPAARMAGADVVKLVAHLSELAASGHTIVTWNGLGFDFDILAEESGMVAECRKLAWEHVDMMFHVFCVKGFFIGLDSAARGSGLPGKTEGISAMMAPRLWKQGKHKEVLDYLSQDVRMTLALANACETKRALTWITKKGKPSECTLPQGWLAAQEAAKLPVPDTSWMDSPKPRTDFTAWLA